ncbi:MAG: mechanosensitive ion channel [Candidatus Theseobacter exili]|nr:mechanosensitive ion channel [Candidatus Theseobacter exili]
MNEIIQKVYGYIATYGINLLVAVVIFFVGKWVAGLLANLIQKLMVRSKVEETLSNFVRHLVYIGLMVFVVIAALNKIGIQTTSLIAVIGAAGLAVGLALQGSLANFAAGVILIIFKPYKVGEFIEAAGALGTVEEIQIFNTVLNAPDNRRIIIPNSHITGGTIANFSDLEKRRVDMTFGISYDDDIKKAKDVLLKIVTEDKRVLKDPAPVVAVSELGDNSVNMVCRPWVKPADYWGVYFDAMENGKVELEKAGCSIPYPQNDVHLYKENE